MAVDHPVWADVGVAECRLHPTASDEHVCGRFEILRNVHCRASVSGCGFWLDARDLESEVVEEPFALRLFRCVCRAFSWEEVAWYGKAFSKDDVCWRCVDVRFECGPDGQESARKFPVPLFWLVFDQGVQGFLQSSVESFHETV